eukprot:CAMPEP_0198110332 /NCGR_PEP_ID=MMETSP1442-20131203/2333_1 /TAXON_ID= /ORGANISM="Craspedostauros australis, Strain CCMP3328" /LENGTH=90 /DNA_ID=CAMNT_0043766321 /DNA_START=451 /DNA_END=723 /DNA_ORIENTATION=+
MPGRSSRKMVMKHGPSASTGETVACAGDHMDALERMQIDVAVSDHRARGLDLGRREHDRDDVDAVRVAWSASWLRCRRRACVNEVLRRRF